MKTITLSATFDGQHIQLDEPITLKAKAKLLVTILPEDVSIEDRRDWSALAMQSLGRAYGPSEPEYTVDMLKEENPNYESR